MALTWHSAVARYAREERGIGEYVNQTGLTQAIAATLVSLPLVTAILGPAGLPPSVLGLLVLLLHGTAILLALLFAAYLKTRLGGITGDTIGATIELVEIAALLVFLCTWTYLP